MHWALKLDTIGEFFEYSATTSVLWFKSCSTRVIRDIDSDFRTISRRRDSEVIMKKVLCPL